MESIPPFDSSQKQILTSSVYVTTWVTPYESYRAAGQTTVPTGGELTLVSSTITQYYYTNIANTAVPSMTSNYFYSSTSPSLSVKASGMYAPQGIASTSVAPSSANSSAAAAAAASSSPTEDNIIAGISTTKPGVIAAIGISILIVLLGGGITWCCLRRKQRRKLARRRKGSGEGGLTRLTSNGPTTITPDNSVLPMSMDGRSVTRYSSTSGNAAAALRNPFDDPQARNLPPLPSHRLSGATSSAWTDDSEMDMVATDGSSMTRTLSSSSDAASDTTLTGSGNQSAPRRMDHPGYTYQTASSGRGPRLLLDTNSSTFRSASTPATTISPFSSLNLIAQRSVGNPGTNSSASTTQSISPFNSYRSIGANTTSNSTDRTSLPPTSPVSTAGSIPPYTLVDDNPFSDTHSHAPMTSVSPSQPRPPSYGDLYPRS